MLADLKPIPVMQSPPNQELFTYATTANSLCDFQTNRLLVPSSQLHPVYGKHEEEALQMLEPIPHVGMSNGTLRSVQQQNIHGHNSNNNNNNNSSDDVCWNDVLGDHDLELENLYKYRPEDSISSVVNTALALNDDLFSSDGSSSDLPTELDLVTSDPLDGAQGMPTSTDWWGFQHSSLDVTLTPLLSISVPFCGASGTPASTTIGNNNNGVLVNGYLQNASSYVVDNRPHQQQQDLQNQPWAECKAALEAAAFDLDDLGDLDPVHVY